MWVDAGARSSRACIVKGIDQIGPHRRGSLECTAGLVESHGRLLLLRRSIGRKLLGVSSGVEKNDATPATMPAAMLENHPLPWRGAVSGEEGGGDGGGSVEGLRITTGGVAAGGDGGEGGGRSDSMTVV